MADFFDSVYKCISSERYTPYSLARKIGAVGILESASFAKGRERYSILMAEEAFKIVQDDDGVAFLIDGSRVPFVPVEDSLDALGRKNRLIFWMLFCMLPGSTKILKILLIFRFRLLEWDI